MAGTRLHASTYMALHAPACMALAVGYKDMFVIYIGYTYIFTYIDQLLYKAKEQYLLACEVSRCCLLTLHNSIYIYDNKAH